MSLEEVRMEVLISIDNFWMIAATWSLVIIGDGGMGDIGLTRESSGGVECNFSFIG